MQDVTLCLLIPFTKHKALIRSKIPVQYLIFSINNPTRTKFPKFLRNVLSKKLNISEFHLTSEKVEDLSFFLFSFSLFTPQSPLVFHREKYLPFFQINTELSRCYTVKLQQDHM